MVSINGDHMLRIKRMPSHYVVQLYQQVIEENTVETG